MIDRHIFVIGMPGSGKSSLGRRVAANLHLPYVDMDQRIVDTVGCEVTEMFARYGEQSFRTAETNLLMQLAQEQPSLISTGGGTVLRPENRRLMQNHGIIMLVDRPLEQIMGDIRLDRRPLLAQKGLPEVERLYNERIGIYREAADLVLDNSMGFRNGLSTMERMIRAYFGLGRAE